jgi:transcriptional regulator with XRE-family HTH domain
MLPIREENPGNRGLPIPRETINRERAARGWSVSELARIAGVAVGTASRACLGKPMSHTTIAKLAHAFAAHPVDETIRRLLRGEAV